MSASIPQALDRVHYTVKTTLVWFRYDLRLADNPALFHAVSNSETVIPVFIWAPEEEADWPPGAASRWWLHHSLQALHNDLQRHSIPLVLRQGPSLETLRALMAETNAEAVYWNMCYEPALRSRDDAVSTALRDEGLQVKTFAASLIHDPDAIRTGSGGPYRVFTPFWKKLYATLTVQEDLPLPAFDTCKAPSDTADTLALDTLDLLPQIDWAAGIREAWQPGEAAAQQRLTAFLNSSVADYQDSRDRPDQDGTSTLSPHLHFGELSPRQVWNAAHAHEEQGSLSSAVEAFVRQIAWREFSYHLLYHEPQTPTQPLKAAFEDFAWVDDDEALTRWQRGQTGYPIVDAGMRQLWHTGWMHNRVRMIVASFLTKDLLITWQEGARWFWDTLVDANLANNTMGWQWVAGSGADAQPFFRIFNPITQSKRYDPDGTYIRRWVPELCDLPNRYVHAPWTAPDTVLQAANLTLGDNYPRPIVDHSKARDRALEAYQDIRGV